MRKIKIGMLLTIFIICLNGCSKPAKISSNETLIEINTEELNRAFEQSCIQETGYRFATAEYKNSISPYATYYILKAKENYGIEDSRLNQEDALNILNSTVTAANINLTDLYCAVMLADDLNEIDKATVKTIADYIDSIYISEYGCYGFSGVVLQDPFEYVYPTFLAVSICEKLGLEAQNIDNWLIDTWMKETADSIDLQNSNAYQMMAELLIHQNLETDRNSVENLLLTCKETISALYKGASFDYYLPVLLMNYEELCRLFDINDNQVNTAVMELLSDSQGNISYNINDFDVFGLYASLRAIRLASDGKAEKIVNYEDAFSIYDSFSLTNNMYIQPGKTEANIIDTYYVSKISYECDIDTKESIAAFCKSKIPFIEEMGPDEISYLLDMMGNLGMLEEIPDITEDELLSVTKETLGYMLDNGLPNERLHIANCLLSIINTIDKSYTYEEYTPSPVDGNDLLAAYYRAEQIILITGLSPKHASLKKECEILESNVSKLLDTEGPTNKMLLLNKCYEAFSNADYTPSAEFIDKSIILINDSKCADGLYKGGDSSEDLESFENSYYGVNLIKKLKESYLK